MKKVVVIILFAAELLRANTIFYNVNFNKDALNQPPAMGGTNSPSAPFNVGWPPAGLPVVVRFFDHLTNRPLLFSGDGGISFQLGRGTPDYTLDFDFETHNLSTNDFFLISPILTLSGNNQMTAPDGQNYSFGWTNDQVHHVHMVVAVGNLTNTWSVQLDNNEPIVGTWAPELFDIGALDFSLEAYDNVQAAIDNIVIGTTTNFVPLKAFFCLSRFSGLGPRDRVARDLAGNFYCTAEAGGNSPNDWGTVFKTDKHGNLLWVFQLDDNSGVNPYGGLIIGDDGFLYGTAAYPWGSVFKMSTDGQLVWSVPFSNAATGQHPYTGVIGLRNEKDEIELYGTTTYGGAHGNGTIFKLDASGQLHVLHSFIGSGGAGAQPSRLVLGDDGFLYGTTAGDTPSGTIFKISRNGAFFTNLVVFDGTNGGAPCAGLTKYGRNTFYGTTQNGGPAFEGTVFRITSSGVLTRLHSFGSPGDVGFGRSENGSFPNSELVLGRDGNFYGTTTSGGITNFFGPYGVNSYGYGTVFRISPAGDFQKLADFHGGDGSYPVGAMIEGEPGRFYGTALETGGNPENLTSGGTIFCLSAMRPILVIESPPVATTSNGGQFEITGKTKCDPPVTNVFYQINGGGWLQATTTNGWLTWSATATMAPGSNTIQAYAVSAFGDRSRTNSLRLGR